MAGAGYLILGLASTIIATYSTAVDLNLCSTITLHRFTNYTLQYKLGNETSDCCCQLSFSKTTDVFVSQWNTSNIVIFSQVFVYTRNIADQVPLPNNTYVCKKRTTSSSSRPQYNTSLILRSDKGFQIQCGTNQSYPTPRQIYSSTDTTQSTTATSASGTITTSASATTVTSASATTFTSTSATIITSATTTIHHQTDTVTKAEEITVTVSVTWLIVGSMLGGLFVIGVIICIVYCSRRGNARKERRSGTDNSAIDLGERDDGVHGLTNQTGRSTDSTQSQNQELSIVDNELYTSHSHSNNMYYLAGNHNNSNDGTQDFHVSNVSGSSHLPGNASDRYDHTGNHVKREKDRGNCTKLYDHIGNHSKGQNNQDSCGDMYDYNHTDCQGKDQGNDSGLPELQDNDTDLSLHHGNDAKTGATSVGSGFDQKSGDHVTAGASKQDDDLDTGYLYAKVCKNKPL